MNKSLQVHFWGHVANTAGSVEKLVLTFARHQTRYTPIIACKGDQTSLDMVDDLPVHSFAESALKNRLMNKLLGLNAFTFDSLVPIIEAEQPDVLHVHNRQELVDRLVARLSYRPAVVVHYHRNFAKPCIPEAADLLLAVSDATRQHIVDTSDTQRPFRVLHNPLTDTVLSQSFAQPENPHPVILYGGGGHDWKGFPELLVALKKLKGNFKAKLCGPALNEFSTPSEKIENIGLLDHEQFMKEIKQADIVVMPSRKEGFPLLALESLHLSKILVASNVGGLTELLTTENAILTEPLNVESLAKGLQAALDILTDNNERAGQLRADARRTAENHIPSVVVARLEGIYDEALELSATRTPRL